MSFKEPSIKHLDVSGDKSILDRSSSNPEYRQNQQGLLFNNIISTKKSGRSILSVKDRQSVKIEALKSNKHRDRRKPVFEGDLKELVENEEDIKESNRPLNQEEPKVNDIEEIEAMLLNYFTMNIQSVKDLMVIKAASEDPEKKQLTFDYFLLNYLEQKDIKDMDPDNIDPFYSSLNNSQIRKQDGLKTSQVEYLMRDDISISSQNYPVDCCSHLDISNTQFARPLELPSPGHISLIDIQKEAGQYDLAWYVKFLHVISC